MRSLLDTVIWVVGFSLHHFKYVLPFPLEQILLKDQLLSLWESPYVLFVVSPLLLLIFVLCVWSLLIWVICVLGCFTLSLSFLGLPEFLGLVWLFPSPFYGSFQLLSPWVFPHGFSFCLILLGLLWVNVGALNIVSEVSEVVLISFNSFFLSASFSFYLPPH